MSAKSSEDGWGGRASVGSESGMGMVAGGGGGGGGMVDDAELVEGAELDVRVGDMLGVRGMVALHALSSTE